MVEGLLFAALLAAAPLGSPQMEVAMAPPRLEGPALAAEPVVATPSLDDRIVFVGHSLVGPVVPQMLQDVIQRQGGRGEVASQIIDGSPLKKNWEQSGEATGIDVRSEIPQRPADVLVITEALPLHNQFRFNQTYRYAEEFYRLALDANPQARVYLYETWHHTYSGTGVDIAHDASDDIPFRERLDLDRPVWADILDHVNDRRRKGEPPMMMVPAGLAMARLHDEIAAGHVPGLDSIDDLFLDGIHFNELGAYFVTMVQYATLFRESPIGLPADLKARDGTPFQAPGPDLAHSLQRIAWEAVRTDRLAGVRAFKAGVAPVRRTTSSLVQTVAAQRAPIEAGPYSLSCPVTDVPFTAAVANDPGREAAGQPTRSFNLNGINDWTAEQPFIDVMKTARSWIGHLPGQWGGVEMQELVDGGLLDENGWPKSIPSKVTALEALILTDLPAEAKTAAGRYRLTFEGSGEIALPGRAENIRREGRTIWFDFTPGPGMVGVSIVKTDPEGTGDYIRNIRVVKEENIARFEAGETFNPLWLKRIRGAETLRFMDWMDTNNATVSRWDERIRPETYSYSQNGGAPVEIMVRLANELGANPWFTIPHTADDDYVRRFATYVRDNLDRGLVAHVEYSNETWNFQFKQTQWMKAMAEERWGAESPGDGFVQFSGLRSAQVMDIFTEVFGEEAKSRLVRIVAPHTGWLGLEQGQLNAPMWVKERSEGSGIPARHFDAYAIAGYFSGQLGNKKADTVRGWIAESTEAARRRGAEAGLSGEDLARFVADHRFDLARAKAARELLDGSETGDDSDTLKDNICKVFAYHADVARSYGLDLLMYEGGTHVVGIGEQVDDQALTDFFVNLNYSPEMGDLYRVLIRGWQSVGGRSFTAYLDVATPTKWGSWGALRHLGDQNPRWDALTSETQAR